MNSLRKLTITGNTLFILWILFNAMDERAQGVRPVEAVALLSLIVLLALNIYLLYRRG